MRYLCPIENKHIARSTKTSNQKAAEKKAAIWEAELREGRYVRSPRVTWEEFVEDYQENALGGLAPATAYGYVLALNKFREYFRPKRVGDLTTHRMTALVTKMRAEGSAEAYIAGTLRSLKRASRWAHKQGMLVKLPEFEMPKQRTKKRMKGRPVTTEEFERIEQAAAKVVGEQAAESWVFYLRGLWECGFRLGESLLLSWDDRPGAIVVDFDGRRPLFRIPGSAQKRGTDELLPMTPEFAKHLETVPKRYRRGWVFQLTDDSGAPHSRSRHSVGPVITSIGKKAGVVVDERMKRTNDDKGRPVEKLVRKFASAHDLRRGFGFRWSRRVMPPVLQELMRHASIQTTMAYYVGQNAESTADELWRAAERESGNTLGNSKQKSKPRRKGGGHKTT
ncbi:tyrosine-type recombinase/integrase [Aeoliella mucimassa]|nr:site-specific integrase [Aeoliella mucimassa]